MLATAAGISSSLLLALICSLSMGARIAATSAIIPHPTPPLFTSHLYFCSNLLAHLSIKFLQKRSPQDHYLLKLTI